MIINKHYIYRVFDEDTYKATWSKDVITLPKFKTGINSGPGDMTVILARNFDNFGEDVDVKLNNKVECWVVDRDTPNGQLLFSGYISGYRPVVKGTEEFVEITVFPFAAEFERILLRDSSGNTTIAYNSYDPANILKDVIDKYRDLGGNINYSSDSISNTNTSVSYTFNTNTIKECLDKIIELAPVGWYWRIDPDNIIYLKPKNELADHTFTIGLDINSLETFRRVEDLVNRVYFTGGGDPPLFRKYENTGSQNQYGLYEKKIVEKRVTVVATAETLSTRIIDEKKDPEIRSRFEIPDSLTEIAEQIITSNSYDPELPATEGELPLQDPNESQGGGQSFLSTSSGTLDKIKMYLKRRGTVTGSVFGKIYAHSGTFGTSSVPTGTALAVSDAVDVSTIDTSYELITFQFSGLDKITLEENTHYVVVVEVEFTSATDNNNELNLLSKSGGNHNGNSTFLSSGTWFADDSFDHQFYVQVVLHAKRRFGIDIESVKPGETLKVQNLKSDIAAFTPWDASIWDTDVWDQTLTTTAADVIQILTIEYSPDSIVIEASSRLPQIAKRVEDINRNLENEQTVDNPSAPT